MIYRNKRNPILPPGIHVPDSEGHVMPDGKLYLYGSFDELPDVYCSTRYHVVSTADMENWTIHDVSLRGEDIPWFDDPSAPRYPGIDWSQPTPFIRKMLEAEMAKGADMKAQFEKEEAKKQPLLFAPDCIERDGTYYLYFCMNDDSEGVAVSDRPEGPFHDPVRLPCGGIDPAIFIDDDGQAYYYWGQLFSHGVKLNPDMKSFDREGIADNLVTEEEHFFHEGSSMRKLGDTYYYVYADMERGKPTSLGYATSKSPLGPFTYRGIIIDNEGCDPETWNNHGSITCVNGQWYVIYHRSSRGSKLYRRLCIEKIEILPDGSIPEVKMTSQGVGEPFAPGEMIEAFRACGLSGTARIDAAGPQEPYPEKLTGISSGDSAIFRYVRSDRPWEEIRVTVKGSGRIAVYMDGLQAGTVMAEGTGEGCHAAQARLACPSGTYELKLVFEETQGLELYDITLR